MNVGIVGCGMIAEKHVSFVKSMRGATIAGIVDNDPVRLELFSNKFGIQSYYKDFRELFESRKVDVVHILTPPFNNVEIAVAAIKKGIHLYIEKPLALTSEEVKEIYKAAEEKGVKVCAGYSMLFEPMLLEAIEQIKKPEFGKVIHVESHYGMNMRRYDRRKTTKDNRIHWSYELPGGFHQNYISHPIYLLIKFIENPTINKVVCRSSGALPQNLTDEIKVLIEGDNATGLLALSYSCEPYKNYLKILGEKQAIKVDWLTRTKILYRDVKLPKAITNVFYDNLSEAAQLSSASIRNAFSLATKRYVPYQGIKNLIEKFYQSISRSLPIPISSDMAIMTESLAEIILKDCRRIHFDFKPRKSTQQNIKYKEKVLVTGASGLVGLATVKKLIEEGFMVRALVRKLSYIDDLEKLGVEIYFGDIRDYDSFKAAAEGMDVIVHLAAAMKVPADEFVEVTVGGVENLINIKHETSISKVIYMSSMSVYDVSDCHRGQVLDESHILERRPEDRGAYSLSKTRAEELVLKEISKDKAGWTILRPSVIFGPGTNLFLHSIGFQLGRKMRLIIGPGDRKLRLIHVDDVAHAIILCLKNDISNGKVYNVNSPYKISKKEYINRYVVPKNGRGWNLYIPYPFINAGAFCVEFLLPILKRKPFLTRYRLMTSQKDVYFDVSKIQNDLGWVPKNPLDTSIRETFDIE